MPGRRSKYTPALVEGLCEALRLGTTRTAACAHVGVTRETFYDWLENKPAFSDAVAQAEADAELRYTRPVARAAMSGDWRAAAFWLERRRPLEYGVKAQVDGDLTLSVSDILRQHLVRPPEPEPLPDPTVIDLEPPYSNGHSSSNGHVQD